MAKTYVSEGRYLTLAAASRVSGDIVVVGANSGVVLNDTDDDGNVVIDTQGVWDLYCEAKDDAGNSAIAKGDPIYASASGAQGSAATVLSKKASGKLIGIALETVNSGAIGQIEVRLIPSQIPATGLVKQQLAGGFLKAKVVTGGSAGNFTVTGIKQGDELVAVIQLDRDSTAANISLADLTSEFTITADDTINNTSGTATTGDKLLVFYLDLT